MATLPPPQGKFVLSALSAGESAVLSVAPSIKLVIEGEEVHEVDGRPYVVRPGQMLFVDRGAPYRATIRRNRDVLGLCVYLPAQDCAVLRADGLLPRAIPQATGSSRLGRLIAGHANRLHREGYGGTMPVALMGAIRSELGVVLEKAAASMGRLDVRKAATRHEVYHRVETARAYLHGFPDRVVPLDELATVAGLSGFQLARHFSAAYGAPPARYHRRLRLNRAADRLRETSASVTEIALDAGYAELSAFSHAFRREFGRAPTSRPGTDS